MKKYLKKLARTLPDSLYLRLIFLFRMKKILNLKNPKTFSEKLQWLKLHDRNPEYTKMVDKYEVRKYIADKIGEEYLIPLLGVWDSFDEIDFDKLPDQFVLKCNHDSGGLVVCRDKSALDFEKAKSKISKSLRNNYYLHGREWPYKDVKPRIIAEKFMSDENAENPERGLVDYKFYCFEGAPQFAYVSDGLEDHSTANINFVTMEWEKAPFRRLDFKEFDKLPKKPEHFEKMVELSKLLSENIHFVRVDFYEINGKVYFGELTFFPGSGLVDISPKEWDAEIGKYICL